MERLSRALFVVIVVGCGSGISEPAADPVEVQAVKPRVVYTRKNVGEACDDNTAA